MVLQAFIDDSGDDEGGTYVLAGYIASANAWAAFSKEWEDMLPYGVRDERGFHFHMNEMAALDERMERVPAFYRIIEKHALMAVSCTYNIHDLGWVRNRTWIQGVDIDWGMMENRYLFASRVLMDAFHTHKAELQPFIPLNQKVDFIFDERSEEGAIKGAWGRYIENRPSGLANRYGVKPRFEDDREFLPLQAADLWAWWVRKWHRDGTSKKIKTDELDFGLWKGQRRPFPRFHIELTREHILQNIIKVIADTRPGSIVIINRTEYETAIS